MESERASLAAAEDRLPTAEDQVPADDLAANEDLAADEDLAVAEDRWDVCYSENLNLLSCMNPCKRAKRASRNSESWCQKNRCSAEYTKQQTACEGYAQSVLNSWNWK